MYIRMELLELPSVTNALIDTLGGQSSYHKEYVDRKQIKTISDDTYILNRQQ